MTILPSILHDQITVLLEAGDRRFEKGDDHGALAKYREAEALLPSERERFEDSTWVLVAIGDALFQLAQFEPAREALDAARRCPQGEDNPFIHLRLGQCLFEAGALAQAQTHLARAFEHGGLAVFEDEDEKYLTYLQGTR
ncbi:tetratricopeptide repeat protein [Chitiniphilus purpureus]|uniref:Tetratricopeptide repeat protein n=1 Tax=Chitiniphilus purpureus TaxID=2981137 RepID=A0ABY6DJ05_9NEIS|nr:tetratricopeptide repeat protein [Chitiniphilus sp. CD1]UXY14341.1 tetratricopeptide repeat protein [Chitiniphilus sp. CD1]